MAFSVISIEIFLKQRFLLLKFIYG